MTFHLLTSDSRDEISALLKSEFGRHYGPGTEFDRLSWNKTDQSSIHLGLRDPQSNELVSYLRISIFSNQKYLEEATCLPTPSELKPPYSLLARAATKEKYQSKGLHSILRYRAIEICSRLNVQCIVGSLETNSLRMSQLKGIGYEIFVTQNGWQGSYVDSLGPVSLIALKNPEMINRAKIHLKNKLSVEDSPDLKLNYQII